MIDCTDIIPRELHEGLRWLGTVPRNWLTYFAADRPEGDDRPRTNVVINETMLRTAPGADAHKSTINTIIAFHKRRLLMGVCAMDAYSRFLAEGPKLFRPTEEQFESMQHVELHMPVSEFRSPFPTLAIRIPLAFRKRLRDEFAIPTDRMPYSVLVHHRTEPGEPGTIHYMVRFGQGLDAHEDANIMTAQDGNEDIEEALGRVVIGDGAPVLSDNESRCLTLLGRVSLNLCLMLTHYGCRIGDPVDPIAYKKHRSRKDLERFKHGDYLAIEMKQNIIVRAPSVPANNPTGPGTGIEVRPHWRRGHWRCYPGQAAKRLLGEKVPLLFVRPCLVRRDRMVGDASETEVVYNG